MAGASLYYFVTNPFAVLGFKPTLSQESTGYVSGVSGSTTFRYPYVNVTISFGFGQFNSIDPLRLNVTVVGPNGSLPFGGYPYPLLPGIQIAYSPNTYPHWLATYNRGTWTGYTGEVTNPDGSVVGGTLNSSGPTDESIESGAIVTLTFPDSVSSIQGYFLVVSYEGAPGVTTLTLSG